MAACEAAGEGQAALGVLSPYLDPEEPAPPPPAFLRGLAPAWASAVRALARMGALHDAWETTQAAEAALGSRLHRSAYHALHEAINPPDATIPGAAHDPQLVAAIEEAVAAAGAAAASTRGDAAGDSGGTVAAGAPRAMFVLEGAQVSCGHGENASSPSDIFLTRNANGDVTGTVDVAREARALVYNLRRSGQYAPVLKPARSVPPATAPGSGGRPSLSRRKRLLSQHAEKKALAAQLALGYPEVRMELRHRMCADCHALFKAASAAYGTRIVVSDARLRHVFEDGACSCRDAGYGGGGDGDE